MSRKRFSTTFFLTLNKALFQDKKDTRDQELWKRYQYSRSKLSKPQATEEHCLCLFSKLKECINLESIQRRYLCLVSKNL